VGNTAGVDVFTRFNIISNITAKNVGELGVLYVECGPWYDPLLVNATLSNNIFSNIVSFNANTAVGQYDFLINGPATDNTLLNCISQFPAGSCFGSVNGAINNNLVNCLANGPGNRPIVGEKSFKVVQINGSLKSYQGYNLAADNTTRIMANSISISGSQHLIAGGATLNQITWEGADSGKSILHIKTSVTLYDGTDAITAVLHSVVRKKTTDNILVVSDHGIVAESFTTGGVGTLALASDVSTLKVCKMLFANSVEGTISYTAEIYTDSEGVGNWGVGNLMGLW